MGRKKSPTSDLDVREKTLTPLAQRLGDLITDANELKEHLGVTMQAVNQYKLGLARPSLENLCKIADFYGTTTDYLLGRTEIKTTREDIAVAIQTTGLSEDSVKQLSNQRKWGIKDTAETIDFLLFDNAKRYPGHGFRSILDLLHFFLSYDDKQDVQKQVFTNGAFADITRDAKTISANAIRINRRIIENAVLDEIQQALISIKQKRLESLQEGKHNGKH